MLLWIHVQFHLWTNANIFLGKYWTGDGEGMLHYRECKIQLHRIRFFSELDFFLNYYYFKNQFTHVLAVHKYSHWFLSAQILGIVRLIFVNLVSEESYCRLYLNFADLTRLHIFFTFNCHLCFIWTTFHVVCSFFYWDACLFYWLEYHFIYPRY